MLAVKKKRDKIKGDTHTPNDIKYQILSLTITILGLIVLSVFGNYVLLLISIALFLMTCWPFVRCGKKKNAMVSIIRPMIIGVRTIVYIIGLSLGAWRFLLKNTERR